MNVSSLTSWQTWDFWTFFFQNCRHRNNWEENRLAWEVMYIFSFTVKHVLSGPHIKGTPSIKLTSAEVPKFSSHIYSKLYQYSADTSVERTRTSILSHFSRYTKPAISANVRPFYFWFSGDSLNIVQRCRFKAEWLYQIGALIDSLC